MSNTTTVLFICFSSFLVQEVKADIVIDITSSEIPEKRVPTRLSTEGGI